MAVNSSAVNKELLMKALSSECPGSLEIKDFVSSPGSDAGDNFASIILKVDVTTVEDGVEKKRHLLVKTLPDDPNVKQAILKGARTFQKESITYTEVFPALIAEQKKLGIESPQLPVPKFYFSCVDDTNGIVVLEDLRPSGYKLADVRKGLDLDHCKVVMREIAALHASSYALKSAKGIDGLKKDFPFVFTETLMSDFQTSFLEPMMAQMGVALTGIVSSTSTRQDVREKVAAFKISDSLRMSKAILENPEESFAIFCHGDFWANNVLFKYDAAGKPINAKLFDFQATRYATLTTDLAYFIYLSTTKSLRQNHLKELLETYHGFLTENLAKMGLEFPELTLDKLTDLFNKTAWLGMGSACGFLMALFSKMVTDDKPAISQIADKEFVKQMDVQTMIDSSPDKKAMHERITGVFEDGVDLGLV